MRQFLIATIATVSTIAFGQIASAADVASRAAPAVVAAPPSWTGWYVGVNGGGVWGRSDPGLSAANTAIPFYATINIPAVINNASGTSNNSGGLAGAQIGYLWQSGPVVFGAEVAFDWMDAKSSRNVSALYVAAVPNLGYTINQNFSSDWLFTALARVGWDMGAWYPYITGGLAVAKLKYDWNYTDVIFAPGCVVCAASFSKTAVGLAIGGGVEWRWDSHWSLRGEYLFIEFDNVNGTSGVGNPATGTLAIFNHQVQFFENIGRAALSYKF